MTSEKAERSSIKVNSCVRKLDKTEVRNIGELCEWKPLEELRLFRKITRSERTNILSNSCIIKFDGTEKMVYVKTIGEEAEGEVKAVFGLIIKKINETVNRLALALEGWMKQRMRNSR